jgi:hypothetical protein
MIPTAAELAAEIAVITGEVNNQGDATISINVKDVAEAKAALLRIKFIKKRLKLLKRESALIQSQIRSVNPLYEDDTFLSDLLDRHISQRLDSNSRKSISAKKSALISLYKSTGFMIDRLSFEIDDTIIKLDEYILRNR